MSAGRNANSLRETKTKIAELTRIVQRLNREVRIAKDQVSTARPGSFSSAECELLFLRAPTTKLNGARAPCKGCSRAGTLLLQLELHYSPTHAVPEGRCGYSIPSPSSNIREHGNCTSSSLKHLPEGTARPSYCRAECTARL